MLPLKLEQSVNNNSAVIEKKPAELKNKSPKYKVLLHNDPVKFYGVCRYFTAGSCSAIK